MTDWTPLAPGSTEDPAERAARESQHQVLIDLLGAYADRELPPETTSQIDAHLVGCVRCRRELAVHHAMRRRLGVEPPIAAPPALRERIAAAIAATPVPVSTSASGRVAVLRRPLVIAALAAAVVATGIGSTVLVRQRADRATLAPLATVSTVPLLRDVLADYRRVVAGDLPGRARDLDAVRSAVAFPIEPLGGSAVRLLAAWTTDLGGEPAVVLAYRWDDRILLQYVVSEERFFQHPALRQAVADGGLLAARDGAQGIVAWPTASAGTLLIADLPPERLRAIGNAALLAGKAARGAP
ncbi:MAG TPA: zf-HC2 domain-containing protein [Gemmatimonadaceae bacterium]|nr:zf-HC2 domain-containing protein [Gemmatimonadaceae bacterium]